MCVNFYVCRLYHGIATQCWSRHWSNQNHQSDWKGPCDSWVAWFLGQDFAGLQSTGNKCLVFQLTFYWLSFYFNMCVCTYRESDRIKASVWFGSKWKIMSCSTSWGGLPRLSTWPHSAYFVHKITVILYPVYVPH